MPLVGADAAEDSRKRKEPNPGSMVGTQWVPDWHGLLFLTPLDILISFYMSEYLSPFPSEDSKRPRNND